MSLITQCPACSTFFRVVPDQLRISDGWVRCGQCDEVFDANASVRDEAALARAAASPAVEDSGQQAVDISATAHAELAAQISQPVPWPEVPAEPRSSNAETATVDVAADIPAEIPADIPVEVPLAPVEAHDAPTTDPFLDRSPRELSDFSTALAGADSQAVLHGEVPATADAAPEAAERRYMQMFAPGAAQADPKLSFMKPVKPVSRWRRPWARAALSVVCLSLLVGLGLQWVLHERDRLAAHYPQYRAEISALAQPLGLEVQPLQQIESMVIDSSAFTKVRNEVYKLSFTLRNTSQLPLATPAMELTLTDMQDQILLRRVIQPKDFAKLSEVLAAGAEQSVALSVAVRSPVPLDKVAGYRLLAFYP